MRERGECLDLVTECVFFLGPVAQKEKECLSRVLYPSLFIYLFLSLSVCLFFYLLMDELGQERWFFFRVFFFFRAVFSLVASLRMCLAVTTTTLRYILESE